MHMTRYTWLLLAAVTVPAVASESGPTLVPDHQLAAVVRDVAQWHDGQHADCRFQKALGYNVVERARKESVEHWTIEGCNGRQFTYRVRIFVQGGGIVDSVSNVDGSPVAGGPEPVAPSSEECASSKQRLDRLNAKDELSEAEMQELPQLAADQAACVAP